MGSAEPEQLSVGLTRSRISPTGCWALDQCRPECDPPWSSPASWSAGSSAPRSCASVAVGVARGLSSSFASWVAGSSAPPRPVDIVGLDDGRLPPWSSFASWPAGSCVGVALVGMTTCRAGLPLTAAAAAIAPPARLKEAVATASARSGCRMRNLPVGARTLTSLGNPSSRLRDGRWC